MRMPPGYRFVPTDYELVKYHLMNKINNRPNLVQQIKEVDLYNYDPPTLAVRACKPIFNIVENIEALLHEETHQKLGDNDWYFFTPTNRKYPKGDRPSRSAGNGYWKATGSQKKVYEGDVAIGTKRTLVYYIGTYHEHAKTDWIMHEYRVDQPLRSKTHANDMKLEDWVLCRVYKKATPIVKGVIKHVQETKSRDEASGSSSTNDGDIRERVEEANNQVEEASPIHNEDPNGSDGLLNTMKMQDSYWDSINITSLLQDHVVPSLD